VHFYELPLALALIGLALYVVLGGADFGAGMWQLTAGSGPDAERIRDHAHESMAPVWEANHVWLVFVLTVVWTAYPTAFGSIASTLSVPLFVAAIGIVLRGAAYALRGGTSSSQEARTIDTVFALSSILTPFALGTAVGAIASRRVPVGNAAGHLFSSWTGPTSILIGFLAVASAAYLAAVFLAADADRLGETSLTQAFRVRALIAGAIAGLIAIGGLVVVRSDAHPVYHGLVSGGGLPALLISAVAGIAGLAFVWRSRFELARYAAALAVASTIAGWGLAQRPTLLPGLTIQQAAAPHDTLVLVIVAVLAGAAILFPSLALLFRLVLRGRFDRGSSVGVPSHSGHIARRTAEERRLARQTVIRASAPGLLARTAAACLIGGFGLLTIADAGWAHALGVACLFAFIVSGFLATRPQDLAG
jgi:cytochrome d ubiquinol oxidase subunit II